MRVGRNNAIRLSAGSAVFDCTGGGGDAPALYFQGYPNPETFQGQIQ